LGGERGWFLSLWIGPSVVFYVLIHMGQHGLIFTFLPALLLAAAGLLDVAGGRIWSGRTVGALAAACGALVFLFAPEYLLLPGGKIKVLNAATLRHLDASLGSEVRLVRALSSQERNGQTWVFSPWARQMGYYAPDCRVLWMVTWGGGGDQHDYTDDVKAPDGTLAAAVTEGMFITYQNHRGGSYPLARLPALGSPRQIILFGASPPIRSAAAHAARGGAGGPKIAETVVGIVPDERTAAPGPARRILVPAGAWLEWDSARQILLVRSGAAVAQVP
jgi:hypothetical protein